MAALKLSDLLRAMAETAGDPEVHSVFLTYENDDGTVSALIHADSGLKALCNETILLATEASHVPARGLH